MKKVLFVGAALLLMSGCAGHATVGSAVDAAIGSVANGVIGARGAIQGSTAGAKRAQTGLEGLEVRDFGDYKIITLAGEAFPPGSSVLLPSHELKVACLADYINQNNVSSIEVVGHTDSVGNASKNVALSQQRAVQVARALSANGVSRDIVQVFGYGSEIPRATNQTAAGRAENRRVEIKINLTSSES